MKNKNYGGIAMKTGLKRLKLIFLSSLIALTLSACGGGGGGGGSSSNDTGTTDTTGSPTITGTVSPAVLSKSTDGSSGSVDTSAAISVTFNKDMDATTVTTATFTVSSTSGTVTYDSSAKKATFTPSSALSYSTAYTAAITTGVKDTSGNALVNSFSWSFTTKQATPATPTLMGGAIQGNPLSPYTNVVTTFAGSAGSIGSTDGTGTAARFYSPYGITTDGTNLFVADYSNYTIRKIVISTGVVTTIAGSAGSSGSTDGTGTSARFYTPAGITTDGTNLFVADIANHTIRKIVISTGVVTTIAGSAGSSGSTDGTGTSARFYNPLGITTDGTNLFVADYWNHTIRKIVISTGVVTTIAGTAGTSGSTDGTGTSARFYYPAGITTDGTNLFVADNNSTIRKIVISTGVVTTIAGTAGTSGSTDGTGTSARFYYPRGITTDGTNLFVADDADHTIRKISAVTTAPSSSPTNVTATAGNGYITIYWDSVSDATCYNLYCAEGTSVTTTTGTETASIASPYVYTGLTNGNTNSCIVTACNYYGEGSPSDPVQCIPVETYLLQAGQSSSSTGSGTITSTPSGIDCGSTCTAEVTNGTTVTLTATPASGSTFAGWSNACSGTGDCAVLMDANKMATAAFMSSGGSGDGGGSDDCSAWYVQFNSCNQETSPGIVMVGGIVPSSCGCPSGTTYAGDDTVTAGGPYKMCTCN
ncbi:MAG: Ig-like domain-containing protein [Deltaproteobacteria bacterium]|nr:Ig-like domain-containing protein [Deltaproteobacteria bacterium]